VSSVNISPKAIPSQGTFSKVLSNVFRKSKGFPKEEVTAATAINYSAGLGFPQQKISCQQTL
jgi:hypothetical protein